MQTKSEQARIASARRRLASEGYKLIKSKAKNWTLNNQCGFQIVSTDNNLVADGASYELDLDGVESAVKRLC